MLKNKKEILAAVAFFVSTVFAQSGGLVGSNSGTIENCYSTASVAGGSANYAGGLTGIQSGRTINSYYDSQTSTQKDNDGKGTPKTTTEMKQQSNFVNWGFDGIWLIDSETNGGFPYLRATPVILDSFSVVFMVDGIKHDSVKIEIYEKINQPIEPTKSGYTFDSWHQPNLYGGTNKFNFETQITSNLTLTAKWTAATPVFDQKEQQKYGILFNENIVSRPVEISVTTPEKSEIKIVIYDITGNVVFSSEFNLEAKVSKGRPHTAGAGSIATTSPFGIIWNLQNQSGRIVANGTYLVVVEAKGISGQRYHYSAKLGIKK